jgi:hypothetical protein
MEPLIALILLLLVLVLVVFPIWAIIRIVSLGEKNASLGRRLEVLDLELKRLRDERLTPGTVEPIAAPAKPAPTPAAPLSAPPPPSTPIMSVAPIPPEPPPSPLPSPTPETFEKIEPASTSSIPPPTTPPPSRPSLAIPEFATPVPIAPQLARETAPPPFFAKPTASESPASRIDWEQFMGAKLFAWLGGLAAFLAVAFFVKYSFEHGWISAEMRATFGFLFGLSLVIGGLKINRDRYAVTSQTLIATGVVSLYAVTFACNSIYKFAVFQEHALLPFGLMTLITVTAFLLAVRLEAHVIAILGILGGFLTPELLSTGQDNPPGLFGYIALLDLGLLAVALHRRWHYLIALGAGGTVVIQIGWASKFLNAAKAPTAMVVCLLFCGLFLGAYWIARRLVNRAKDSASLSPYLVWSAVTFPFVAFCFAAAFLGYGTIAARPGLLFSFVLAADVCLLALAWWEETLPKLPFIAGAAVFALLAAWTGARLTSDLLPWALACYLGYAALHTAFPLLLERHRPAAAPDGWAQIFPPLALLLMLGPLFKLDAVSLLLWPSVLLVDLIAIALALLTASLTGVAVALVLTLAATGLWIFRVPVSIDVAPSLLLVVGGFAVLFFAASSWLVRRLGDRLSHGAAPKNPLFGDARAQIPAFSALLPFALLIMMTQRLPFANPSSLFGLGLLLVVLTLGLAAIFSIEWLGACALVGIVALEATWRARHFTVDHANLALAWFLLFYAVFAAFPFLFRRRFSSVTGPWAIAALAGVLHFPLVYQLVGRAHPNDVMGLLPALFALPPLASLFAILRAGSVDDRARLNQLAWFGGVALFFITLIFPIQFERQWITLGWALEGAALLWLFHRVPHPALRATGVVLLVTAFARLALNPAVFSYHARSATPLFNWYLYSYGILTAALFAGARLLAPPRDRTLGLNAPALLNSLGTVLAFLLLNIEIADYFTPLGTRSLTFEFSGNFARDMTYTIAWALFALALLLIGIWKRLRLGRYAAQALLAVAMLKLFFHDLAHLDALYRIGAFLAVAVIAILASVAYQMFQPSHEKKS